MIHVVENRTHRRIQIEIPALVSTASRWVDFFFPEPKLQCVTRDVSMQGMKLIALQQIPVGSAIQVWVRLLDDDQSSLDLKLRGNVRWSAAQNETDYYWAGVQLDAWQGKSMTLWTNAIRERIRDHFKAELPVGVVSGATPNAGKSL